MANIQHYFTYKGKTSKDFGLKILNELTFPVPEREMEFLTIPGRHGTLPIDMGRYEDIIKVFPCKLFAVRGMKIDAQAKAISEWLRTDVNWHKLTFTGYKDYYYKAMCQETFDIIDLKRNLGELEIPFRIHPIKRLISGENPVTITQGKIIRNPEQLPSKPLIQIKGSGDITIRFVQNGSSQDVSLQNISESITLDCETQQAYNEFGNQSQNVYSYPFPELKTGDTKIEWTGDIQEFTLVPRWGALV